MKTRITLLLFTVLLFICSTKAQIVHTDLNPDSLYSAGSYNFYIDLDNNNIDDYHFEQISVSGPPLVESFVIRGGGIGSGNSVLEGAQGTSALNLNDVIGSTSTTWFQLTSSNSVMGSYMTSTPLNLGEWENKQDKYIGVKFLIGANFHYGWIKLSTGATNNEIIVKEYAYNVTPNDQILAGQTSIISTGIKETILNATTLYPNPASDKVYISGWGRTIKTIVAVNVSGKQFEIDYKTGNYGNIELDIEQLKSGFYTIIVTDINDDIFIQKIFKNSSN